MKRLNFDIFNVSFCTEDSNIRGAALCPLVTSKSYLCVLLMTVYHFTRCNFMKTSVFISLTMCTSNLALGNFPYINKYLCRTRKYLCIICTLFILVCAWLNSTVNISVNTHYCFIVSHLFCDRITTCFGLCIWPPSGKVHNLQVKNAQDISNLHQV